MYTENYRENPNIQDKRVLLPVCITKYSDFHNDGLFVSPYKRTQVRIPDPKCTSSVFDYKYSFFLRKKKDHHYGNQRKGQYSCTENYRENPNI